MKKEEIGNNAGIVWHALISAHGKLSFKELLEKTGLLPTDMSYAIGWLAREHKIVVFQVQGEDYYEVFHECYY